MAKRLVATDQEQPSFVEVFERFTSDVAGTHGVDVAAAYVYLRAQEVAVMVNREVPVTSMIEQDQALLALKLKYAE